MAPILNNLLSVWYERLAKTNQTKYDFYTDFLPIRINDLEQKRNRQLEYLDIRIKNKLLQYEIKAGIKSEFLELEYSELVKQLEEKFYWKKRALIQQLKRAQRDADLPLKGLEIQKQEKLSELNQKYHIENPLKEDKEEYVKKNDELSGKLEAKRNKISEKHNKKTSKIKTTIEARTQKYETKIKKYKGILANIVVKEKDSVLPDDVLLKIDNLSMHFGGLKAVDELSFDVKEGEIFGLIGPNGAGKTTVFNCITRFYRPTSGNMYFRNLYGETTHLNKVVVHNIIKEGIVRTFQNVEMVWELNVVENLLVAAHTHYRSGFFGHLLNSRLLRQEEKVLRSKAEKILTDLDLIQYAYSYPYGLPYGILKKIELARTLMVNPKLIILDEPAAGLNDNETEVLAETIKKIREEYNATIFLVEHDMGLVMNICDTVCAISFGKKLDMGTPKEIQNSEVVRKAYLGGE